MGVASQIFSGAMVCLGFVVAIGRPALAADCRADLRWVNRSNPGPDHSEYLGFFVSRSSEINSEGEVALGPRTLRDCGVEGVQLFLDDQCSPWTTLSIGDIPLPSALHAEGSSIVLLCSDTSPLEGCTELGPYVGRPVVNGWLPDGRLRLLIVGQADAVVGHALAAELPGDRRPARAAVEPTLSVEEQCGVSLRSYPEEADAEGDYHWLLCPERAEREPAIGTDGSATLAHQDPCAAPRDAGAPPSTFGVILTKDASARRDFSWGDAAASGLTDGGGAASPSESPPLSPRLCSALPRSANHHRCAGWLLIVCAVLVALRLPSVRCRSMR